MEEYTTDYRNISWLVDKYLDIPEKFKNRGLRHVSCYPALIDNYEVISVSVADIGQEESNFCYINANEPRFAITGFTDTDLSDYQKDLIYEYTSTHWNEILQGFKDAYNMKENIDVFESEESDRYKQNLKLPQQSPDYRLLKNI